MEESKIDRNAILHMWRQIIEQTGVEKYTSEQWQVQYEDFCRCMLSSSQPFVAIQSIEGLIRNAGIPLQAPLGPHAFAKAASTLGIAETPMSVGAQVKKLVANSDLLEQQRVQQQQIYQQVHQQQQEQLKSYDKENVPILLQKCVNATRKLKPQSNPEQEATQNNVKLQGIQNYRIPRKIQDLSQKPLPLSLINALNGSKYSLTCENSPDSGKEQEENEKEYILGAIEMDNMQVAVGGSDLPDVQPENERPGEEEMWLEKNFNEETSTEVHLSDTTSEFVNNLPSLSAGEGNTSDDLQENNKSTTMKCKESRKKKNKSKKRDD